MCKIAGTEKFSRMSSTHEGRARFAQSAVEMIEVGWAEKKALYKSCNKYLVRNSASTDWILTGSIRDRERRVRELNRKRGKYQM